MNSQVYQKKNKSAAPLFLTIVVLMLVFFSTKETYALTGTINAHDPSAIIKDGTKYWMFTTGQGIYAAYSTDLIQWTSGPQTIFPIGTWPSWITAAVPGFAGEFWAPDCIYMNGKYYLYYSCSTFGSAVSVIGVASSPTLDPSSPNYLWTDLGMVKSSSANTDINAIDPALLLDTDGRVYMSYGSFHGGIGVIEIDPLTGKVKTGSVLVKIAGGSNADWEAPYIIKDGSYYYLFVNRGYCCQGTSSTYYIVMGRSSSIAGPYLSQTGVNLNTGNGTTVLSTSGKYIGPGHVGLLRENGSNFLSIHYYDGSDSGNAKLDILNLGFNSGWPFLTRDWIASGQYKITNKNSSLVWDSWGCTGANNEPIAQGTWNNLTCQKWNLTPIGDGLYKITNALGGRSPQVINCDPTQKLQEYDWQNTDCQKFKIERAYDGSQVFTSQLTGNKVVEVPGGSLTAGVQLGLLNYNGNTAQRWSITLASLGRSATAVVEETTTLEEATVSAYPNPSTGAFKIVSQGAFEYGIAGLNGKQVENGSGVDEAFAGDILKPGMYILHVKNKHGVSQLKLIKK